MYGAIRYSAALLCLSASACVDIELPYEIKDLRILALRCEPAEIMYPVTLALPEAQRPPPQWYETTFVNILAVDPRHENPIEFETQFCPHNSGDDCRNFTLPKDLSNAPYPEMIRYQLDHATKPITTELPVTDDTGTHSGYLGSFWFSDPVVNYLLPHDDSGAASVLLQQFGRIIVSATSQEVTEVAYRRLPFHMQMELSSIPADVRSQFEEVLGVEICPPGLAGVQAVDCLQNRQPNQNPRIDEVRYSKAHQRPQYDEEGRDKRNKGTIVEDSIDLYPGEDIRLWPVLSNDAREAYQVFEVNIQTGTIELANYKEDMVVSYFTTQGMPNPPLVDLKLNKGYSSWITFPAENPPERVMIYIVVRDQRGGVAWKTVELRRRKPM